MIVTTPDRLSFPARELDPQARSLLQTIEQLGAPPIETLTPDQARESRRAAALAYSGSPEAMARLENLTMPGPAGEIPIRIYTPAGKAPFPILIYFHGGGWVVGDLDTHDPVCRALANRASCLVISVDYRLAPEHKHPAAIEDAYAAAAWVAQNAARFQGDPNQLAVGGDSAGGHLATVVALMARDQGAPALAYQLLIYPVTDLSSLETASYRDYAQGYLLPRASMKWFRDHYLRRESQAQEPYASPLLAQDLSGLPPALVITAEFDVLRDEGEAYARGLAQAGVPVKCTRYLGMMHGFVAQAGVLDQGKDALDEAGAALQSAFSQ